MSYFQKEVKKLLKRIKKLGLINTIPKISRYEDLNDLICDLMSENEGNGLKILEIFKECPLKPRFKKREIGEYIQTSAELYSGEIRNPLLQLLRNHRFMYGY